MRRLAPWIAWIFQVVPGTSFVPSKPSYVAPTSLDVSFTAPWQPSFNSSVSWIAINEPVAKAAPFQVYCDLDGVLVDFAAGIRDVFGNHHTSQSISSIERGMLWRRVEEAGNFFGRLPWTPEGRRLWEALKPLQPTILTGVPTYTAARKEKVEWCRRELGFESIEHVDSAGSWRQYTRRKRDDRNMADRRHGRVITCWSEHKYHESGQGAILIDDRESLRENWEAKGGIFVHHCGDVDETLQTLKDLGVLA